MSVADAALIAEACSALGVVDRGPIGAPGGQKAVRRVERAGEDLVLKVVALTATSPTTLTRAEREVELLKSLNSPHVVKVVSDLVPLGSPAHGATWLEEFLDGDDLGKLLTSPWSWSSAARLGYEVALGLAAGHAKGVIHRDLSPNNVRRLSSGAYKVMDFGFARHTLRTGITVAGQPGTPGFFTPEHLNAYSGVPMPASDVFGVGILLYLALTGKLPIPHLGDDVDYARRLQRAEMVADIGAERPDLGADEQSILRRMLHAQPARRFTNGQKLADALEPFV
jgi:eukaryotic-like serine/threonine-protein kinase